MIKRILRGRGLVVVTALLLGAIGFSGSYAFAQHKNSKGTNCPGYCVSLSGNNKPDPEVLTIPTGSYVQFNAVDGAHHNIALEHSAVQHDDPSKYESGDFAADEAYKIQFKHDGAYTFRDTYNPDVHINVVAYTPGKNYSVEN